MSRSAGESSGILSNPVATISDRRSKGSYILRATSSIAELITPDASLKPVMNSDIPTPFLLLFLEPVEHPHHPCSCAFPPSLGQRKFLHFQTLNVCWFMIGSHSLAWGSMMILQSNRLQHHAQRQAKACRSQWSLNTTSVHRGVPALFKRS